MARQHGPGGDNVRRPAALTATWRSLCCVLAIVVITANGRAAHGQVDTPAAREARAIVRDIADVYESRPGWGTWSHRLALEDVEYELRMGEAQLRAGAETDFRAPLLQRLGDALETRAAELMPIAAEQWPDACYRQAEDYTRVTPEAVQGPRRSRRRVRNCKTGWTLSSDCFPRCRIRTTPGDTFFPGRRRARW